MLDKTKQNNEAIYDDSIGGPFIKEMKRKFDKKKSVNIDIESIEKIIVEKEVAKNNSMVTKQEGANNSSKTKNVNNNERKEKNQFNQKTSVNRNTNINRGQNRGTQNHGGKPDNKNKFVQELSKNQEVAIIKEDSIFEKNKLKIIPLGGLHEIGKNLTVFEYGKDIIIVDCGVAFPTDDMLGVDLVIPDITYLEKMLAV